MRRLTITEQGLGHTWRRLRPMILARDGYRCHWCGNRANTVDHLVPRAEGGARYDPTNLVAACTPCNMCRGAQLGTQRRLTRRGQHTADQTTQRRTWTGAIDV